MVVADPEATLLTACENGYGKRTYFGPNNDVSGEPEATDAESPEAEAKEPAAEAPEPESSKAGESGAGASAAGEGDDELSSGNKYRSQRRGGKGLRDIKTTERNGKVIGIVRVDDTDELFMMTTRGKLQRIAAGEISVIGRNTQGVRIMSLDDDDKLAAIVRIPKDEAVETPPA
jgi:DNA gyrase subunit A